MVFRLAKGCLSVDPRDLDIHRPLLPGWPSWPTKAAGQLGSLLGARHCSRYSDRRVVHFLQHQGIRAKNRSEHEASSSSSRNGVAQRLTRTIECVHPVSMTSDNQMLDKAGMCISIAGLTKLADQWSAR